MYCETLFEYFAIRSHYVDCRADIVTTYYINVRKNKERSKKRHYLTLET